MTHASSESKPSPQRGDGLKSMPWAAIGVLMYVSSIGPLTGLQELGLLKGRPGDWLSHAAYSPLRWLSEHSEIVRIYLLRYMLLFTGRW